jgi:hypothetical protein
VVAVDDTEDAMRAFMASGGWTFPVVMGAEDAANAYGARFIPSLFVIDPEGYIVDRLAGGASASDLSALIDGLTR